MHTPEQQNRKLFSAKETIEQEIYSFLFCHIRRRRIYNVTTLSLSLQVFFFCLKEPADGCGGETILLKNSEILSKLNPEVVRKFEEKQVRYFRYMPDKSNDQYLSWQHAYNTDDRKVNSMFSRSSRRTQALLKLPFYSSVVPSLWF